MVWQPTMGDEYLGMAANADAWDTLVRNHDTLYKAYQPSIVDNYMVAGEASGGGEVPLAYFRVRGNEDLLDIRARLLATGGTSATVPSMKLDAATSAVTASVNINSASAAWYTVDVTPTASGVEDCVLHGTPGTSDSLAMSHFQIYLVGVAPGAPDLSSGFIRTEGASSILATANAPVTTERVERLLHGPIKLAVERPLCVFSAFFNRQDAQSKTTSWSAANSTTPVRVGMGWLPPCGNGEREFILDGYLYQTGSGGTIQVSIGNQSLDLTADGWTAHTGVMLDASVGHDIVVTIESGGSNTASLLSLQVWRAET